MAKKTESKELQNRALTAIQIASELKDVVQSIIDNGGECDDNTLATLQGLNLALEDKAENIGLVKTRIDSEIEYFKAVKDAADVQIKSRESALDKLREYLATCMRVAGVKSLKKSDGLFSVSLCTGRVSTFIDDVDKLPYDLVEIVEKIKPKTNLIKQKLEAGEEVAGAHLERTEDYITIRGGALCRISQTSN